MGGRYSVCWSAPSVSRNILYAGCQNAILRWVMSTPTSPRPGVDPPLRAGHAGQLVVLIIRIVSGHISVGASAMSAQQPQPVVARGDPAATT